MIQDPILKEMISTALAAPKKEKFNWPKPDQKAKKLEPHKPTHKYNTDTFYSEQCEACFRVTFQTNRHHPIPQAIKKSRTTIRLCFPCHAIVHQLTNERLAEMPVQEQLKYIRKNLKSTHQ